MSSVAIESSDLHQTLHEVFGFSEFRALQEEAVRAAVAGRDVLVVMPTGAGKSLCFQLPAALAEGVTVIVSPLVALMRDQVEALTHRTTFSQLGCAYINSLQSLDEQRELLSRLRAGRLRLVYIAPERFRSAAFIEALQAVPIARFVVDEAHCISEWGHDFRPDYLSLKAVTQALGNPPLTAVTATATVRVQQSIIANLGMREPETFIGGFNRPNLHFAAIRCKSEMARQDRLARALPKLAAMGGSGLIYVPTRKQSEEVAALAARALAPSGKKAGAYHAGMDAGARNQLQSQWLAGAVHVLVATNAFGMGIDKPDVRFVVHYGYPESLESYYQESGRAGRDGRKSRCVILHQFADRRTREWFIDNEAMKSDDVRKAHAQICARSETAMTQIPKSWWMQTLGWNEVKARLTLGELERSGLVQRLGETGEETILRILKRDFPRQALSRIATDLERQREERYRRLDEMTAYCKTTGCRRRMVLSYFGDREPPQTNGFCCDNCERSVSDTDDAQDAARQTRRDRPPMPQTIASSDIHALLQGMDALRPQLGKARLNKLLRASNAQEVQRFKNDQCPLYGALRGCSSGQVEEFLSLLIERGLLNQGDEDAYFVCNVTDAGRAAWQEKTPLDIPVPAVPVRRSDASRDSESALLKALRDWRRAQANGETLPPYCVLSDRALLEIEQQRPQNESALRSITGIGDVKLQKYGGAILAITREGTQSPNEHPIVRACGVGAASTTASAAEPVSETVAARLAAAIADLPATVVDTYVLLEEGRNVEEIAEQRGLGNDTIWTHLEKIIRAGLLDDAAMEAIVPTPLRQRIEDALASAAEQPGLKPVWEQLNGEVDYGPIRCVAAYRARLILAN